MPGFYKLLLGASSILAAPAVAGACAVCLTGAASDPLTDALNWSVLFLMATPYTVAGAIAAWLVYLNRRSAAATSADGGEASGHGAMLQKEESAR